MYIFFLLAFLFSCCKTENDCPNCETANDCQRNNFIIAGKKGPCMIYRDFNPDIELIGTPSYPYYHESINIDINRDGINDIQIQTYDTISSYIQPLVNEQSKIKIGLSAYDITYVFISGPTPGYSYYGCITKYKLSDTIKNKGEWSLTNGLSSNSPTVDNGPYVLATPMDSIGLWYNTDHQYAGVRFIHDKDTLFGWIGISVLGSSHIIVHDCAYQVKSIRLVDIF